MNIKELFASGIGNHPTLNPLLWLSDHRLRPEVSQALQRIAKEFVSFLDIDLEVLDIILTGSQANYHYTGNSDLDLHIIVDRDQIDCDISVEEFLNMKRDLWKQQHDIRIHHVPVECYVEDVDHPVRGSSYSIIKDQWIHRPDPYREIEYATDSTVSAWCRVITAAIQHRDLDLLVRTKKLLKQYRQASLDHQGEFGRGNVVYKVLRNSGVVDRLYQAIDLLQDLELSVQD